MRLIITLATQRTARCPVCQSDLPGDAAYFLENLAYCHDCSLTVAVRQVFAISAMHAFGEFAHLFTESRGLHLYTPDASVPRHTPANIYHVCRTLIAERTAHDYDTDDEVRSACESRNPQPPHNRH